MILSMLQGFKGREQRLPESVDNFKGFKPAIGAGKRDWKVFLSKFDIDLGVYALVAFKFFNQFKLKIVLKCNLTITAGKEASYFYVFRNIHQYH